MSFPSSLFGHPLYIYTSDKQVYYTRTKKTDASGRHPGSSPNFAGSGRRPGDQTASSGARSRSPGGVPALSAGAFLCRFCAFIYTPDKQVHYTTTRKPDASGRHPGSALTLPPTRRPDGIVGCSIPERRRRPGPIRRGFPAASRPSALAARLPRQQRVVQQNNRVRRPVQRRR